MGVIGAGGQGSDIVEALARLGVRNFIVIAPDLAEISNINRVAGMTLEDGHAGVAKVEIAIRAIRSIIGDAKVPEADAGWCPCGRQ